MRRFGNKISLVQNNRGIWDLDTVKGCKYGMARNKRGCYSNCYAFLTAHRYGYDFSNSNLRSFESSKHLNDTIKLIKAIKSNFIRIGVMGDPSECWGHTIDICDKIRKGGKKIVIITKHWEPMPEYLYPKVKELKLIINTSVSAIDEDYLLKHRMNEYNKLKSICTSVLRIVSCDFNTNSIYGTIYNDIQDSLFKNENIIDNALRIPENHYLVKEMIVNVKRKNFLSSKATVSMKNKNVYFGYCKGCKDQCGANF